MIKRRKFPQERDERMIGLFSALTLINAFFFAIGPIFDPYVLFRLGDAVTIKVMDIPMLLFAGISAFLLFLKREKPKSAFLICLIGSFAIISLVSSLLPLPGHSLQLVLKNTAINLVYSISITLLWSVYDRKRFIRFVFLISILSTIFLIVQFLAVSMGITNIFDGKIPFLGLGKYDGWAPLIDPNTGDTRVHSFFQEPSYYGVYILPAFGYSLKSRKYVWSLFFGIGIIVSTSLLSLAGAVVVIVIVLLQAMGQRNLSAENSIRYIFRTLSVGLLVVVLLYTISPTISETIDYLGRRIFGVVRDLQSDRMGSTRYRLLGSLSSFSHYSLFHKVFGVGNNQYAAVLSVPPYSSVVVSILLDYGILGIVLFTTMVVKLFRSINRDDRVFIAVFVVTCFTDHHWMNWYFLFLLTWCLPASLKNPLDDRVLKSQNSASIINQISKV